MFVYPFCRCLRPGKMSHGWKTDSPFKESQKFTFSFVPTCSLHLLVGIQHNVRENQPECGFKCGRLDSTPSMSGEDRNM